MDNIKEFLAFAESLKLNQKAELFNEKGKSIIKDIYTDLFPNNAVNDKVNLSNTTILTGRKGTGKSTIFLKSIEDQIKNQKVFPIYLDIKTIYDRATPTLNYENSSYISKSDITKYLLYKNFLKEIILEVKKKAETQLKFSLLDKIFGISDEKLFSIQSELNSIERNLQDVFTQIDINLFKTIGTELEKTDEINSGILGQISSTPKLEIKGENKVSGKIKEQFQAVLLNFLNIKALLIDNLFTIKEILGIKHLYIYLDDFSEINLDAQEIFIDWFIAPLNNLSENYIKFKIATYRGRLYLGKIDRSKIDFVHLDFFEAYNIYNSVSRMEELALDYNKRLVTARAKHFFIQSSFYEFFDIRKESIHELLFEISMNIPRKLGYILSYCYESHLIHETKITRAALGNAAQRYYEEITESYFEANPYVIRPFNDKINIANQMTLMNKIIAKQKFNKQSIAKSSAKIFTATDQPTSHFVVNEDFSYLLNNLELNGFVSTYNKIKDKSNISSTLFALDFGLCRKHNLNYGRPKETEYRKYYNDSRFSLNHIIREHFNSTQVLKCKESHEFNFDLLKQFEIYEMNCPTCIKEGLFNKLVVTVSNKELIDKIKQIERFSLLDIDLDEYRIIHALSQFSPVSLSSKKVGELTDLSYQYISRRIQRLTELGYIQIDQDKSLALNKDHFLITAKAKEKVIDLIVEKVKVRIAEIEEIQSNINEEPNKETI